MAPGVIPLSAEPGIACRAGTNYCDVLSLNYPILRANPVSPRPGRVVSVHALRRF
jgi:hypothetical protein